MKDAITSILDRYDITGKYLDNFALNRIQNYFSNAYNRIKIIEIINSKSSRIVREAAARLYNEQPELLRPGGNSYTTRRYAACLRDIEYYLRYASYAIIAGDINILNERVLDGLKETYNSLNVPIGPTIRSIKILEEIIQNELQFNTPELKLIINEPFEHIINSLSEENI
uniref:allophycocyanin beta 18 subunit n=1 Tax=Hypnea pseudomusciformis TaxID=1545697 RepID=UPI0027DA2697|nr:allophycocyanin beta 18 subunit [Hypnea pseudomusciformis]WCH55096.1 allophycocyanin beta 18 subunit [Hypnea pseudomusciformis]WCH55495.1 allophycocyanin beta 18 subunit [Hypnea pseudomusciformis]WCH56689.1 allophycocyanin beta 18 subunit [Hypnea pseudomusciformis]